MKQQTIDGPTPSNSTDNFFLKTQYSVLYDTNLLPMKENSSSVELLWTRVAFPFLSTKPEIKHIFRQGYPTYYMFYQTKSTFLQGFLPHKVHTNEYNSPQNLSLSVLYKNLIAINITMNPGILIGKVRHNDNTNQKQIPNKKRPISSKY